MKKLADFLEIMSSQPIDILWVVVSASLVFLMQAGFLCLEAGSTRRKNNINVVVKNIADLGVSVLCFWMFGFALMFGHSASSWFGTRPLMPDLGQGEVELVAFFLFQVMFCSTAVTIVSGAVAERMRFDSYLVVSVLVSGLIYPIYGHWVWNGLDRGTSSGWLGQLGFVDFAGSTVVHSVGGWVALATVMTLGPRLGRFSTKRNRQAMMGYDMPLALLGVLLLWLGWFGFNGGSTLALNGQVPGILANTVLAGAAGLLTPIALNLPRGKPVPVMAVMNGSLAGLVAITANCHTVSAAAAVLIGVIGSLVMLLTERWLYRLQIDDVVGAIPVHLGAGIWGTLALALLGDPELIGTGLDRATQLRVQLLGVGTAGLWAFGISLGALSLLQRLGSIRVSRKHEQIGLNVAEHGATSDLLDLFAVMRQQERTGSLQLRAPVESFTLVGQIAQRYNRMMNALEEATARNEAIVQTATEAIVTVSKQDLRICTANPAVRTLFDTPEIEICGQSITSLIMLPSEHLNGQAPAAAMAQFLSQASGDNIPYEVIGQRRNDGTLPIETTVSVTRTRQDDFYTLILRDITLRKQAEDAILDAKAKDRKSRQLEQALKELQETQLQLAHSEKMSSLGQLVAGVAHEINNPVSFIYGNLPHAKQYVRDLLRVVRGYQAEHPDTSEELDALIEAVDLDYLQSDLDKLLKSMEGGAERIIEIVDSLRDFSRLGGTELKTVNIQEGIESTLTILRSQLRGSSRRPAVHLVKRYGALPPVECYASQLNQVFMNLFSNAIDALDEKAAAAPGETWAPKILIATQLSAPDRLQVHVADNGIGIPEELQQRILDPFFTTKPVGKGTGLGMSISYKIVVEHHGGKLKCVSAPQRGTRIIIEIPTHQRARQRTEPGG